MNTTNTTADIGTHRTSESAAEKKSRLAKGDGMARRIKEMERQVAKAAQRATQMHQMAQSADARVKQKQERLEQLKLEGERMKMQSGKTPVQLLSTAQIHRVEKDLGKAVQALSTKFGLTLGAKPVKVNRNGSLSLHVTGKACGVTPQAAARANGRKATTAKSTSQKKAA